MAQERREGIGQSKLALIHILKRELQLGEAEYRRILRHVAGVGSARDLTPAGFRTLMRYLVRSRHYVVHPGGLTLRQKLFIRHLQGDLEWTDEHLAAFLRKYHGVGRPEELDRARARKAIESLKHIVQRRLGLHGGPDEAMHGDPHAPPP